MIATDTYFHLAIAEAGRNPYFTSLFPPIVSWVK
jgi:DNA-binding FadR family transcriptional regulator